MRHKGIKILGGFIGAVCLVFTGINALLSSDAVMGMVAEKAGVIATEAMDSRIQLNKVEVKSWREIQISDIDVYDKQQELMAHVDNAIVTLSPLAMLKESATEGIDTIDVEKAEISILQRENGEWNYEDFLSEEESSAKFKAKINIVDSVLKSRYNDVDIVLDKVNGHVDMANYPAISVAGEFDNQGAKVSASATIDTKSSKRQTFQVNIDNADIENYLPYVPKGTIPEDVIKDISGQISNVQIAGERVGQEIFYHGQLQLDNGSFVLLEENKVENTTALLTFNEKDMLVFANAETQGQKAAAHGKIIMNNGSPILDITAKSESFNPLVIIPDIPYRGDVKFLAHITGQVDNPRVDADVEIAEGAVDNVAFSNMKANISYADSLVIVNKADAGILGGSVEATGTFDAKSYDFTGNAKISDVNADEIVLLAGMYDVDTSSLTDVGGRFSADLSFAGNADTPRDTKVFGSVNGADLSYKGLVISELKSSMAKQGDTITIDYLSTHMPNGGTLGLEGTVTLEDAVDISFYGSEIDLTLLDNFIPDVPIAGFMDVKGTMKGAIDDPIVIAKYAAHDGSIYHQPYDRLHGSAGGSLRGVKIDDFVMEDGDHTMWYAEGVLGFLGDMGINMRVDTVGARMEDIMQAVAPEQNLTGNVDNVITIKGSLKDPDITGYVHFYQGSYNGIFLNGMDGDYYVRNKEIILQDFHVFTPWIDVDFNGTIDADNNIDLDASVHEVNLSRYNKMLPIPLGGKAMFDGKVTGKLDSPLFNGKLSAQDMTVNGQEVSNVGGIVRYENGFVFLDDMVFEQGGGSYSLNANVNIDDQHLRGKFAVTDGDINSIVAMAGLKDNGINGAITGDAVVGGTLEAPEVALNAVIKNGSLGSYTLSDVIVNGSLDKRKIFVNELSGTEGENGAFSFKGIVDMDGDVNIHGSLTSIDVGAIAEAAKLDVKAGGKLDTFLDVTGTYDSPVAVIPLSIKNLRVENTLLDSVEGEFRVANRVINIEQFASTKTVGEQKYVLSASGSVPFAALTDDVPNAANQFNVNISLENADLSLLPAMSKYVDWAVGPMDGNVMLRGTAASPYITGSMKVDNGAVKIRDVVKPITAFNAHAAFDGHTLTLEQFSGNMGTGNFNVNGFVHLAGTTPDDYNLDVVLNKLDVDCPVFKGPLTANVNVQDETINPPGKDSMIIPKVSGDTFLENVIISLPSEIPSSDDDMPVVAMDFDLNLGKNVRFLSSSFGDLRLAGGAHFGGLTVMPNTSGSIYVTRGNLSYLKTNFKVYEGALVFGQAETLMPKLVLKAGTKINKTQVFLGLDGPLTNMKFILTSNPKMPEAEIIQLLTLRSDYYNRDQSDASRFTSMLNIGLQMTILSEVESAMRNALSLDLLTIQRDTISGTRGLKSSSGSDGEKNGDKKDYEVYNITLGKNISDKALIKFTQSLTTDDYSYGIDYELSDKINLTYTRDNKSDYYAGIEARFTF